MLNIALQSRSGDSRRSVVGRSPANAVVDTRLVGVARRRSFRLEIQTNLKPSSVRHFCRGIIPHMSVARNAL